jgi:hypothetical protein
MLGILNFLHLTLSAQVSRHSNTSDDSHFPLLSFYSIVDLI